MRGKAVFLMGAAALPVLVAAPRPASGQTPLGYVTARGSTITPAFEGWYPNPDGTLTLSWGFYNRNSEETLEIPFGPDNFIEPAEFDGAQPTHFPGGRQWGAFGVVVPGDYDGEPIKWTLEIRGGTFMIPSNLSSDWKIDALEGEADGNKTPELALAEGGPWFAGPGGDFTTVEAEVWAPTPLTVWARDDGGSASNVRASGREGVPVTLTWFKHSGPGDVTFDYEEKSNLIPIEGGSMTTNATFGEPGEYIIRIRANDSSGVSGAGHSQCCWTNAFMRVTVTG